MKWTCKDGRVMDIKDMTTDHLRNAVCMVERKGFVSWHDFESAVLFMGSLRGEYAQMAAENEIATMKVFSGLDEMREELARRAA